MTLQQILDDINDSQERPYIKAAPQQRSDIPLSLIQNKVIDSKGKAVPKRINGAQQYQVQLYTEFKDPHHKVQINITEFGEGGEAIITSKTLDEQLEPVLNPPTPVDQHPVYVAAKDYMDNVVANTASVVRYEQLQVNVDQEDAEVVVKFDQGEANPAEFWRYYLWNDAGEIKYRKLEQIK